MKILGDFKSVINNKVFMKMYLAQAISNFGDAVVRIALIILISSKTQSVAAVSSIMVVQIVPAIVFGPLAGVLIDRFNRRVIMIISDIFRAFLIVGIVYSTSLWMIYLLSFFIGVAGCFYSPARISLIPDVVGKEQYMSAHSLSSSTHHALALIGPALGGMIIAFFGVKLAFIIDAISFILSAIILLMCQTPHRKSGQAKGSYLNNFKQGLGYIKDSKQLLFLLCFSGIILLIAGGYSVLFVDYINNVLKAGATHFGFIESMLATGLLLSSLVVGYFSKRINRGYTIVNSMLLSGCVSCFMFTKPSVFIMYIWAFVIGCTDGLIDIPLSSLLIENTTSEVRGRVMSVYSSLIRVCSLSGLAISGGLASKLGTANTMGVMGVCMILIGFTTRYTAIFKSVNCPQYQEITKNITANVN